MVRLAHWVLRHELLVALFWVVALLAGGATAGTTTERLTVDVSLPAQPGYETEKRLVERYGIGADEGVSTVALHSPDGPVGDRADAGTSGDRDAFTTGQRSPQSEELTTRV